MSVALFPLSLSVNRMKNQQNATLLNEDGDFWKIVCLGYEKT